MNSGASGSHWKVPFNRSSLQGRELDYIMETIGVGQIAGNQTFSRKCQELLEQTLQIKKSLLTTSCTHALEMAAMLLKIQPGEEVIVPDFTFVSTPNAFALHGARPVFCDIRPDTLNLDESKLDSLITPLTRAIVPVHYAGVGCELDAILEIAARRQIAVIEDNAHGLFGKYKGRWLGTFGDMAAQSFHETKNLTCGEGGALLLNDPKYIERAEIIREKGTNRARFFRGQVDKYSWVDLGSSYVMSDVLAAFLYGQLEEWPRIQANRKRRWELYHRELAGWASLHGIRQPVFPSHCDPAWHMYYLILPAPEARQSLILHLQANDILAVFHYQPLHRSEYAISRWGESPPKPVSDYVSDRILRLPLFNSMTDSEQGLVIDALLRFNPAGSRTIS